LKLSGQVRSTHNQDGAVVLDIRQGRMFRLNLVGSRMLELLRQGCSETQIAAEISREFGAGREIVETDLREFLTHLQKHHLVELGPPEARPAL
jgi:Coenzyme PQQ synthesis protein D (PqqD)